MAAAQHRHAPALAQPSAQLLLPSGTRGDAVVRVGVQEQAVIAGAGQGGMDLPGPGPVLGGVADEQRGHGGQPGGGRGEQ